LYLRGPTGLAENDYLTNLMEFYAGQPCTDVKGAPCIRASGSRGAEGIAGMIGECYCAQLLIAMGVL
jgi:hypothetical protein